MSTPPRPVQDIVFFIPLEMSIIINKKITKIILPNTMLFVNSDSMTFSVYGVAIGKNILTAIIDNIHFKKDKRLRTKPFFNEKKEGIYCTS